MNSLKKNSDIIQFFFLRIFSILSAILYLGNVTYKKKATGRDEGLDVGPPEVLDILSQLLKVEYFSLPLMYDTAVCRVLLQHFTQISQLLNLNLLCDTSTIFILWERKHEIGGIIGIRDGI